MGNKLIKIGNDVSCPKLGEKINYCLWLSVQTSKVIFFLVQMEELPLPYPRQVKFHAVWNCTLNRFYYFLL